jgi:hypothetical protein
MKLSPPTLVVTLPSLAVLLVVAACGSSEPDEIFILPATSGGSGSGGGTGGSASSSSGSGGATVSSSASTSGAGGLGSGGSSTASTTGAGGGGGSCGNCADTYLGLSAPANLCSGNSQTLWNAIDDCVCTQNCATPCAASFCSGSAPEGACTTCVLTNCTTPASDCLKDSM